MSAQSALRSRFSIFSLFLVLGSLTLVACDQAQTPATTAPVTTASVPDSEPTDEPAEPLEGLLFSQTHWINEQPIGQGREPVTAAMLTQTNANPEQWIQFGGDFSNARHSPITELSPANIDRLQMAWGFPTGTPGQFSASPIVYDGIMYVSTSFNRLFALDAVTGELHWRYDHQQPVDLRLCCGPANRGVAIVGDSVIMATLDARLLSFDRKSGAILWNVEIADYKRGFSATSAPLIVKNLAIIGVAGGEYGVRGFFDAYDVNSGALVWRHYTVPAEGEPGVETWAGDSWRRGGAPAWTIGAYDPALDTLYWTTGNPGPDWNGDARLGDNLFSNSLLALDPDTGVMKWYFQYTPHDVWDYDGNSTLFLVDNYQHNGQTHKAIVQANRNGFFYAIDRESGEFLKATTYVEQLNWAMSMEASGRPVVNPQAMPNEEPTFRVCPGAMGGMNGSVAGARNPALGLVYLPVIESCQLFQKGISVPIDGISYLGGTPIPIDIAEGTKYGSLTAVDIQTGDIRWRYRDPDPMMAGVLSTAGGLVITGSQTGHALALDAATGEELWRFNVGGGVRSQPIAYQVNGETFVAIPSGNFATIASFNGGSTNLPEGGNLYVFKLRSN